MARRVPRLPRRSPLEGTTHHVTPAPADGGEYPLLPERPARAGRSACPVNTAWHAAEVTMAVTLVHIHVKPEHIDAFIDATRSNHEGSVREPGNLRFDVIRSVEEPDRFVLYEWYVDRGRRGRTRRRPTTRAGVNRRRLAGRAARRGSLQQLLPETPAEVLTLLHRGGDFGPLHARPAAAHRVRGRPVHRGPGRAPGMAAGCCWSRAPDPSDRQVRLATAALAARRRAGGRLRPGRAGSVRHRRGCGRHRVRARTWCGDRGRQRARRRQGDRRPGAQRQVGD